MERPSRILIVDDDAAGRAMLALLLRRSGFDVDTAAGGPQALELLSRNAYAWMITDSRMSPMGGLELAKRAVTLQPRLRVCMISAFSQERDILGYPIERLFPKPLASEALIACLVDRPAASG